jgi:hypothetical protein
LKKSELDLWIAEHIMGWKVYSQEYEGEEPAFPYITQRRTGELFLWFAKGKSAIIFKPTRKISSAWKVVEKLRQLGYFFVVNDNATNYAGKIHVNFHQPVMGRENICFRGFAKKAPLAICIAARKTHLFNLKDSQVPHET